MGSEAWYVCLGFNINSIREGRKKDLDSYILTKQELLIMNVIWERGSATVKKVCNIISQSKATAYTTILTFMKIMEKKRILARGRWDRSHLYRPIFTRHQATRNQANDLLACFFDGNLNELIETILENEFKTSVPHVETYKME